MRVQIGAAVLTTDCIAETQRKGVIPELSQELVDMVVEFVVQEMVETKDGSSVRSLMHSSSILRLRVVKAFEPPVLRELEYQWFNNDVVPQLHSMSFRRSIIDSIWDAVQWWVSDVALRRHELQRPSFLDIPETLSTTKGLQVVQLLREIIIDDRAIDVGGDNKSFMRPRVMDKGGDGVYYHLDDCDVAEALTLTLDSACAPRAVSVYDRTLWGSLSAHKGAVIEPRLLTWLAKAGSEVTHEDDFEIEEAEVFERCWRWDTVRFRLDEDEGVVSGDEAANEDAEGQDANEIGDDT